MKHLSISYRTALLLIAFLSALISFSCQKAKVDEQNDKVLDINLLKSAGKYSEALTNRESGSNQPFSIEDIKTEGTILKISVKGGCQEDAFIIWDGTIMESHPAQISFILTHEPNPEGCNDSNEYDVTVDLTKIIGTQDPKNFIFRVANGSVKQDKSLKPDGSVTSGE